MQQKIFDEYDDDAFETSKAVKVGEATRNVTYQMIKPSLPKKRQIVYEAIILLTSTDHPDGVTRKEIAKHLKWPINCVTGRVTELRDLEGLIGEDGAKKQSPSYDGHMYPNGVLKPL